MSTPDLNLYKPKTEPDPKPNLALYGPGKFSDKVLSSETTLTRDRSIDLDQTHLDANTIYGTSLNEGRAAAQTTGDKWASGLYKGLTTFATATGETAGVVLGGLAGIGMTALGNEWDSDVVFKNPIVSYFADLNDRIAELNPNYYSEAEHNASVLSNMGTANFWSDKVMNGIGFMASAMLTAGGAAKIGAKLGLKAVGSGTKLTGMSVSEGVNTLQAGIIGRMGESGIEANETYENTLHTLEAARKAGENNYSDEEIEEMAKDARAATFGFNMMLAVPDAYQFGKVFKTVKGQNVGRSLFGKSRVGHAAEQFIIESQEENYQLAVSNTALKMAKQMANPETEQGAGEYLGNIVGGMVDNFRTKEGQESMVLGGLLGGGMGLAFKSNDRTQESINNIPEEILRRNNQMASAIASDTDAEKLKGLAIEKNDLLTATLIEGMQLTNRIYTALANNKIEDLEAEIDMLAKNSPEEFLTGYEIEISEEEIKAQHQLIKHKVQQAKDRYQGYPQDMHPAVKGNLFFIETAMDDIRDQIVPANLIKGLVDIKLQNDEAAGIETDLDATMTIGQGDSVVPSTLFKEIEMLSENLKTLNEEATLLKGKGTKSKAARQEAIDTWEQAIPKKKKVVKKEPKKAEPIGTIQKQGQEGVNLEFVKETKNDDNSTTYTIRDDEGNEDTVNSKDGWKLSGVIQETRGTRVERDTSYKKHEILDQYAEFEPRLKDLIENDPNWRDKVKVRVAIGKSGSLAARMEEFKKNGHGAGNIYQNKDINKNTLLIPSTTINFNITVEDKDGREQIIGHVPDPFKYTDLNGTPIDLNSISDEEFYENFTFTEYRDGTKVEVKDADRLERLRREQAETIEFFQKVEAWFEGKPDNTELPAEFMDVYLASEGFAHEKNGEWKSPSEHEYLKDENGEYTIIDKLDGYNSVTNKGNHANSLSTEELITLHDTRYLIRAMHPTLGEIWVKAAPQTMDATMKKEITKRINDARLNPTKKQIDELNAMMYIAYKGDWNFKFDKTNITKKNKQRKLRIDAFKTRSKVRHRIPIDTKVTNLNQLATIIKNGTGTDNIQLTDSAYKNSIPKGKLTTAQADKMFTVNVEPKIVNGVAIHFGFNSDKITLESTTKKPVVKSPEAPSVKKTPKKKLTKKEKIQKEIEEENNGTTPTDEVFKKSSKKASHVINMSAAKQYLADKLPKTISVEEMETIIDNLEELQYTWGKFADNTIYLSEEAEVGTEYHEAFHAVFRTLLTTEERNRLYKISTSKIGRAKPIVHEESMADQFTAWKNNKSIKIAGPLRAFFNRIVSWAKWILGMETELEQLFRRIDSGAFQNKVQDFSQIHTFAPAYKLLKGHRTHFKMTVSKSEEIINTAAGYAYNNIKGYPAHKLNDAIEKAVLDHMDTEAELFNSDTESNQAVIESDPAMENKLIAYEGIYLNETNRALVVAEVQKLLSMYGATSVEQSREENDADERPERTWDMHQGEVGGFKNINKEIKQFIALAQYETYDTELKRDVVRAVNFTNVYTALQRRLSGKKHADMLTHFKDFAETDIQVAAIYDKFLEETGYNPETEHKTDPDLFIRFLNTFRLENVDYIQSLKVLENEKVQLTNLSANRDSAEKIHFENWKRQGSNLNVFKNNESRVRASVELNKASSVFELESPTHDEVKEAVPQVIEAFKSLGIDLSTGYVRQSLEEFYDFKNESDMRILEKKDITVLADILSKGDNLYTEELDTETGELLDTTGAIGRLNSIASGDINFRSDIFETNFQDAQNKTRWAFVQPSYILEKIRQLKNLTPSKLEELKNDPYFKHNPLLQDENVVNTLNNLATAFTGDFRDTTSAKEGVTFKTTNPKDLLLSWYALYNDGIKKNKSSFYTPMIYEAKSTAVSVQLPDKNWVTSQAVLKLDNMQGYFMKALNKETIQHFIDTVFTQEHQRLNGETGIEYIEKRDNEGNIVNPWVTLPFFNGVKVKSTDKFIADYTLAEIEADKDGVKTLIANTIKKGLAEDMVNHANELVNYGILEENNNEFGIPQNAVGPLIVNFFLNDFNNSVGISQLLVGDLSQFKDPADHVKRMGGAIAYGTSFGDGQYRVVYKSKDEAEMEGYDGLVDKDDAQVYTTVERRIEQLVAHGALNKDELAIWEKIRDGKEVTPAEYDRIDGIPLKTVHFDGNSYHKMSEAYLSRAFVSNNVGTAEDPIWEAKPERVKLHNMLEFMLDNDVHSVVTMSASKMRKASNKEGGPQVETVSDADFVNGTLEDFDSKNIAELNNSDLRLQVENKSGKQQIVSGTQMAQLIDLGLEGNPELQQEYYSLLAQNRADDFAFANKILSDPNNVEKIAKKLIESVESTGGDAQMMEFLETFPTNIGTKKFKYNLNLPHVVEKVESMFLAHLSKGTLQQKVPGYKLTLMSASGVQVIDKTTKKPRDLKMHKVSKDGKTIERAEVLMTRGALTKLIGRDKAYLPIEEINKELLEMVGTRIPTQAHHSMIPFEIVEFLPEDYKDTVIAPAEITKLSGADYDIDSLFVYRKDFYVDVDGEVIIYGKGKTLHERYSEYVNYHSRVNKTVKKALAQAKIELSNIDPKERQEMVFEEFGLISSLKEFRDPKGKSTTTNGARNNRLVDIYLEILANPEIEDMFKPASLELLDNASTTYFKGIQNKTATKSMHYTLAGKFEAHKSVSTGKKNIGPIASANNVSAFFTKSKIRLKTPLEFLDVNYDKYEVMEENDIEVYRETPESPWQVREDTREDQSKVNSLSTLVSGMTDDAKHGYAAMLNLEQYNLGTFANMISLGMGFNRTMLFASQEVLIELSKEINTSEQPQATVIREFMNTVAARAAETGPKKMTAQSLVDNLQKRDPGLDMEILAKFIELQTAAKGFQATGKILGLNKGEVGNSIIEMKELDTKMILVQINDTFLNLSDALLQNANTSTNLRIFKSIQATMGEWFISGSVVYGRVEDELNRVVDKFTIDDAKTIDRSLKSFLTAKGLQKLMQKRNPDAKLADFNGLLDPGVTSEKVEKTLARKIEDLSTQEDEEAREAFNNNEFIKVLRLNFKFVDGKFHNKSNPVGLDLVESNMRIKRSPLTVDRVMNGFLELSLDNPQLAQDFLRYAMVKDNMQFTNNSFLKFIDAALFKPVSRGLDNILTEEENHAEEFLKIFSGFTGTRSMIKVSSKDKMGLVKVKGTTVTLKTADDFAVQAARLKLTEEETDVYITQKLKEQNNLPFILRQYEGPIYHRVSREQWHILPPFGPKVPVIRRNKSAIQQAFHQTYEDSVAVYKNREGAVMSANAPVIPEQEQAPLPTEEEPGAPVYFKPGAVTEDLSSEDFGIDSTADELKEESEQFEETKEKKEGLPAYSIDRDLKNADGSKRLAHTDGSHITINPVSSIQEFFDYFTGKEGGISSKQKQVVLSELGRQGYPLARIEEILTTKKLVNTFLILHEQDHIDHKDQDVYWKSGKDLLTPDKIAIETRATVNALNQLGTPVPWETKPTGLFKPGAAPKDDNISDMGDSKLSKESTMQELTSYNFSKMVKKLSKRFGIKVELVHQEGANWLGRYHGGTVFLNTALLKSDTPFHEFAHPFIEAIRVKNKALYESLVEQILKEKKILARVEELYPELDRDGQIEEAIVTAIGNYAADIMSMPKTLIQKIKDFLKEVMNIVRGFFEGGTVWLPSELNPQTTLQDLAAIMAKGDQVFELGELSDDQVKYSVQQATKLTVQADHVDLVRSGDKTVSLREVRDDILYDVGDELNVYTNGQQQGIRVKLKHVQTLKTLSEKYREPFAKALGYASYKEFISEDAYAKEDSPLSLQFPGVYRFLQGKQPMQILNYEVIDEYETGKETDLEKQVNEIRRALIKQINHFKKKITEGNPRKEKVKLFVKRQARLLKALDAIDDAKGLMEFIDVASKDVTDSLRRLNKAIDHINSLKTLPPQKRKEAMELIFKTQETISAYSMIETIPESELIELLGEGETAQKFMDTKKEMEELRYLIDQNVVPLMASWLISFSNIDPKKAKEYFAAKIKRLEESSTLSDSKRKRLIEEVLQKQEELVLTQDKLEDQLRLATREIGLGSLWLEAAASSSDHVTSLFSKALKRQEFEANTADRIAQLRLGVALEAFEKEQKSKGNRPEKFYSDLYTTRVDEETNVEYIVFADKASTPAGENLLKELKAVYKEAQDQLPESVRLGDIIPYIRKSGTDRMSENGIFASMKAEWQDISKPLVTDDVYGYQTADGKSVKQVPIYYVFRGEGKRAMKNEDISKDLVHSVLLFTQMSNKYKAYQDISAEVDLFSDVISKRGIKETTNTGASILDKISKGVNLDKFITTDSNRVNERIQEFINMQYYGKMEKPWIVPIGEKEIDINKLINFIGKWTGFSTLALNFLSAINNVVLGNFYMFQEAMARQHYDGMQFDLKKGYTLYGKGTTAMFSDIGKLSGKSKETQLVDLFDAMQGSFRDISGNFVTGSVAKKLFNGSTLFFMNHAGEHEMQVSTLFAALASTVVKDRSGNEITLWDAYQLDKNGELQIQEGTQIQDKNGEWRDWTETDRFEFQNKLHSTNKSLHGNYNDFDRTVMQKSAIGRLVLMFRKFIAPGVRRRFGTLSYDNEQDEMHQGYFRTTINLMIDEYMELANWMMWKENSLTGYEKANVKKTVYEFGMLVSTMAMFAIATSMLGDDDDKTWASAFALYQIRRFQSELSFYYNPMETLKIITSPAAAITTLKRGAGFLNQLKLTMMFNYEDTHYKTSGHGFKKGDSKLWASFKKLLPVIQGVERSLAPQEAIKYFDKLF